MDGHQRGRAVLRLSRVANAAGPMSRMSSDQFCGVRLWERLLGQTNGKSRANWGERPGHVLEGDEKVLSASGEDTVDYGLRKFELRPRTEKKMKRMHHQHLRLIQTASSHSIPLWFAAKKVGSMDRKDQKQPHLVLRASWKRGIFEGWMLRDPSSPLLLGVVPLKRSLNTSGVADSRCTAAVEGHHAAHGIPAEYIGTSPTQNSGCKALSAIIH
ncbi:hypothetical protein K438DRAFT_1762898 [Mycena galopus ATCC 62051]|nr:hypothetical protein K438DRAFT_1762898 [Mycena galopus ATCC 62051]